MIVKYLCSFLLMIICLLLSCNDKNVKEKIKPDIPIVNEDQGGNILYNGIVLPELWPPKRSYSVDLENGMEVPYLSKKPDTINISIGRQLFVDDFLIEKTTMSRRFHYAEYYHSNPILEPNKEWENMGSKGSKFAAPFSDGIWYDEVEGKFKMWYMAGGGSYSVNNAGVTCYAESTDGINWEKINQSLVANTNIVDFHTERDASVVWLDKQETDYSKKYKMFLVARNPNDNKWNYRYKTSNDGKLWREVTSSQPIADRSTVFKNPFREKWIYSIRHNIRVNSEKLVRARDYNENQDPELGTRKAEALLGSFWFGPWPTEQRHPDYPQVDPAIYNQDAIAYESIMLGLFNVWQGPENDIANASGKPKRNQIMLGYSRDGYHWLRNDMNPFIALGKSSTSWNSGNLQSVTGAPIIVGDKLYFYVSGRYINSQGSEITSTGLAILRRDGFVSMDAIGEEKTLTTESFKFNGQNFFVNAKIDGGMQIELLDKDGKIIPGFSRKESKTFTGDATKNNMKWTSKTDLSELNGKVIRAKFYVTNGSLYAFWLSPSVTGESNGYTAGGVRALTQKDLILNKIGYFRTVEHSIC